MIQLLFKPFEKYSETVLIIVGFIAAILASIIAFYVSIRFDGVFDMHLYTNSSIAKNLVDNALNTISLFIWLFIAAKITYTKSRIIDILAVSIVARIPLYFTLLFNLNGLLTKASKNIEQAMETDLNSVQTNDTLVMAFFALITIVFAIWFVALLYNGFKVSANAKGTKPVLLFIAAIILAEITSKISINFLNS